MIITPLTIKIAFELFWIISQIESSLVSSISFLGFLLIHSLILVCSVSFSVVFSVILLGNWNSLLLFLIISFGYNKSEYHL
jgi:hypothetical protein